MASPSNLAEWGELAAEVIEAEGRSLRRAFLRLAILAGFGLVLLVAAIIGAGFALAGIYLYLSHHFSFAASALWMAGVALGLVLVGLLIIQVSFTRRRINAQTQATRARLKEAIGDFDPLSGLRRHPFALVMAAAAVGALAGLSAQTLKAAADVIRAATRFLSPGLSLLQEFVSKRRAQAEQSSSGDAPQSAA